MNSESQNVIYLSRTAFAGRNEILEALFREHGAALEQFLRMHLALEADREDIIQDVLVRLARIEDLSDKFAERPDTVRSYLFMMARNLIRDNSRRAKTRQAKDHVSYNDDLTLTTRFTPERTLQNKQNLTSIQRGLDRVKNQHRQAFEMSRFENKSYREIGQELGISISTVEKHISAVLYVLREEMR